MVSDQPETNLKVKIGPVRYKKMVLNFKGKNCFCKIKILICKGKNIFFKNCFAKVNFFVAQIEFFSKIS